jgi:tetratricopeptide (TPR) repeat protein
MRKYCVFWLLALIIGSLALQGCDNPDPVTDAKEYLKKILEELRPVGDRDAYKPIREGRVELVRLPNGPELMTWEKFNSRRYDWHLKTYVQNYEKHGHRSAVWDDEVRIMLGKYAVFRRQKTSKAFMQDLLDQVNHILELGCKDPRIISIKGIILYNLQSPVDAAPFLKQGLELLERSSYPKRYSFFTASHLCHVYGNTTGAQNPYKTYQRAKMKYLGQAVLDHDYLDGHQRYYMQDFVTIFSNNTCSMPEDVDLCMNTIDRSQQIDPWIALVAKGIYHIDLAWNYRGNGYAKSVSEENYRKFKVEIAKARKCLVQAYELHPEYPEAAAKMISVSMAIPGNVPMGQWFDRAIKAHFDYLYAYDDMLWALRPRWRGSHVEMLKFGIECLSTERFDTRVPSQFLVSLFKIGDELDNWRKPYQWPGVYKLIQKYFNGLLSEPKNKDYEAANKSFYVVVAWAAGHYQDAHRMMQELGTRFDRQAYSYLKVSEEQVLNDIKR